MPLGSDSTSVKAQCQIVVFPWTMENPVEDASFEELSASSPIDVSREMFACSFNKTKDQPAGSFSFSLANTRDWKRIIRPGQWCLIYMSNEGDLKLPTDPLGTNLAKTNLDALQEQRKRLRGICYIDRVAVKGDMTEEGLEVAYEITGRDIGIVYEEATIWHNFFRFESGIIDAAVNNLQARPTNTVDELLKTIHSLFYSPRDFASLASRDPKDPQSLSQVGFQWLMPREIIRALGLSLKTGQSESFFGNIDGLLNFSETKATYPIENVMSTLNGNAWEKLKTHSVEQFHELFVETDDEGAPKLTFRPIPWKLDGTNYPLIESFIPAYKSLADDAVPLKPIDVMAFDLGEDNHARYNHFLTQVQTSDITAFDNISELQYPSPSGRTFPYAQTGSIARHGFRPMHVDVNALIQLGLNVDGKADQKILVQYNEVIFDYWNNAIFFESGGANIIGNNAIKIGKAVLFDEACPYNANKLFYIEGYTDEFTMDDKGVGSWTQSLVLTRGTELDALKDIMDRVVQASTITKRGREFGDTGSYTGG